MMMMVKGVTARTGPTVVALALFAEIVMAYLGTRPIHHVDQFPQRALESAPVRRFFSKGTSAMYWREKRGKSTSPALRADLSPISQLNRPPELSSPQPLSRARPADRRHRPGVLTDS